MINDHLPSYQTNLSNSVNNEGISDNESNGICNSKNEMECSENKLTSDYITTENSPINHEQYSDNKNIIEDFSEKLNFICSNHNNVSANETLINENEAENETKVKEYHDVDGNTYEMRCRSVLEKLYGQESVKVRPLQIDKADSQKIEIDHEKGIYYRRFTSESDLQPVIDLITNDLSEPYSIYTYRYFIYNWPRLCIMAFSIEDDRCVGAVVGKTECHSPPHERLRGYIAMLAVQEGFRRRLIGSRLVELVIETMILDGCSEVVLETEITNQKALSLYEKLGFIRDKRLFRYYLNGVDAFRLKLWMS